METFGKEVIVSYSFGKFLNGLHGSAPKYVGGLDDSANRAFFNGNTEFLIQTANYGVQSHINR